LVIFGNTTGNPYLCVNQKQSGQMSKRQVITPSLRGLFDKVLTTLEKEIESLPDTLQQVTPEKRLDFVSKNLPLLLKYRESGQGDSWGDTWGE